ncbi:MAG: AsmA-like C-terminal region-containing protein, partial [Methyloligellaceae bacterium]
RFAFDGENEVAIQGVKNSKNVWNVNARGSRFNGQSIFRGLFKSSNKNALIRGKWKRKKINLDLRAEIETVKGYSGAQMQSVSLSMQKRKGELSSLDIQGTLPNNASTAARLVRQQGRGRIILTETSNAGAAFRLIGLYPSAEGGQASVRVFLDGEGDVQRTGTLWARDFYVLGDPIVQEVLSSGGSTPFGDGFETPTSAGSSKKQEIRQRILFQQLEIPFTVGRGQFVLHNSIINGPLLGATVRGRVDFEKEQIDVGGTYVPLYGINSAIGVLPFIGQILTGRRGEGFLGITFGIQGKLSRPQVLVNPMSMVAPGIFRQIFEFGQPPQTLDSRN